MPRIFIAGQEGKTKNYERMLSLLGAEFTTSLHLPDSSRYDALLLPGGGDIDPKLFGQLNRGTRSFDPALDRLQLSILKSFVQSRKPVLGICKGMQLINIFFGGDLFQDLPTAAHHQYAGGDRFHEARSVRGSFLYNLYGERFTVNSAHHQGIDSIGQNIRCIQYADDQVAEALVHVYLPVYGVQWHPERLSADSAQTEYMPFCEPVNIGGPVHKKRSDTVDGSLLFKAFLQNKLKQTH